MTTIAPLLLADGRLPVGGHAYSAGLEPALAAGLTADQVPEFVTARLTTVGRMEAAATVLSHRRARVAGSGGSVQRGDSLQAIQQEVLARTASQPLRQVSGRLGRGLLRLIDRCWPLAAAARELHDLDGEPQRPVALGVACALSSMSEAEAARVCFYDDAQTVCSAALKLMPVDPLEPVGWLLAKASMIEQLVDEAVRVSGATALPAPTAPLIEQWSLIHDLSHRRIFSA